MQVHHVAGLVVRPGETVRQNAVAGEGIFGVEKRRGEEGGATALTTVGMSRTSARSDV